MSDAPDTGRSLWRRARRAQGPAGSPPSDEALAAYLDGRAGEAERDVVEAWLAEDADALAFVADHWRDMDAGPMPARVAARAKALVRAPGVADRVRAWLGAVARPLPVGAVAAVALFAVAGHELGEATYRHALAVEVAVADALVLGAGDLSADDR